VAELLREPQRLQAGGQRGQSRRPQLRQLRAHAETCTKQKTTHIIYRQYSLRSQQACLVQ
jgi:hypothetical protein